MFNLMWCLCYGQKTSTRKQIDLKNNNNSQARTVSIKIREYGMNDNETFIF